MNATFRFAVKACLLAAVSGALFNQVVGLYAQDGGNAPRDGSAAPKIRQTASIQEPVASQPQTSSPQAPSEVQKKLQELYRKNGREMPSMNMEDLPNVQPQVTPPAAAPTTAPATARRSGQTYQSAPTSAAASPNAVTPSKPNFFERLFHVGRGRKQPAAVAQPSRPAAPATPPARYPMQQPMARPSAPVYRAPIASVSPQPPTPQAPQTPQQPQLREPAAIGAPTTPAEVASRPAQPAGPALRPGQRSGFPQPLLDESDSDEESESLELNEQPKLANQPPQILPNQTANGPAESPYTGVKISPNEMEKRIATTPNPLLELEAPAATNGGEAKVIAPTLTVTPTAPASSDSPTLSITEPAVEKTAPAAAPPATPNNVVTPKNAVTSKNDDLGLKDEDDDDDDDDDDEMLTLPDENAAKPPQKAAEPAASKSSPEKPNAEKPTNTEQPTRESDKPATPGLMKGFRGFCPVVLKDDRKLIEARPHIRSEYRGKVYTFSTLDAKEAFDENPRKYIPAGEGNDVVKLTAGETGIEGTLEHAAWYRGRLYMFSSPETRREFVETPSKFVVND